MVQSTINISTLVQIMAWRRPGDKPLSEPMLVSLLTHLCITRPQYVIKKDTDSFMRISNMSSPPRGLAWRLHVSVCVPTNTELNENSRRTRYGSQFPAQFVCCGACEWMSDLDQNPRKHVSMMTSSNGNIFRVTGPLCGEFTGPGDFPTQRPVTQSFDVFFDLRLNKRLSKQPWGWWFETPLWSLWRQCNWA